MTVRALLALAMLFVAMAARAATFSEGPLTVTLPDAVPEGQPFLVEVAINGQVDAATVEWMGKAAPVRLERRGGMLRGEVLLGAGLGASHGGHPVLVAARITGRAVTALGTVRVASVSFPEQRLTLPQKMVTPPKETLARIKREQEMVAAALSGVTAGRSWGFPFLRPVPGEVTSAFGLRRILNGQPKSPHSGIDLDARLGEEVLAANAGTVVLTGDFYYNGQSVFVDHGQGVFTMYCHLSRVDVAAGQRVEKGQLVGLAGATGRATGPHLHFGMKILGQTVDPMALFAAGGLFGRPREGS